MPTIHSLRDLATTVVEVQAQPLTGTQVPQRARGEHLAVKVTSRPSSSSSEPAPVSSSKACTLPCMGGSVVGG